MTHRFTVRTVLPGLLWEVTDHDKGVVEHVLFGDYGVQHARAFTPVDALQASPDRRAEVLQQLAQSATRSGVRHSFVPRIPFAPVLARPGQTLPHERY